MRFTLSLFDGFVVGAAINGFMRAPWITVLVLAFLAFVISSLEGFATKRFGAPYGITGIAGGLAFAYLSSLWFAAAFGVGRIISSLV
jgi:hypothetical protein